MSVATRPATPATTPSWPRSSPRYTTPRDRDRPTIGTTTAAHLARLRRARPYDWQRDVADVAGELNETGDGFRYPIVVLSVPRRGGKSTLTLAVNLDRMDLAGDARCWYTAHTREVAAKLYRDEWVPMLDPLARLYRLRKSQGSEGVHKRRGSSRLQLFAPNAGALHSTNADCVTVDEAWAFDSDTGEAVEAGIRPAQLTRPWRQTWIVSAGGTLESTWWDRWLIAGEQATPGVALFDYGADAAAPGYDPSNPAVWAASHPTAGVAFPLEVLAHEWNTRRTDADFERAYLNVWPRPSQAAAAGAGLDTDLWYAAAYPDVLARPVSAIAVDVASDRSRAAIAVAASGDGGVVVEVIDARPGIGWVAGAVRDTRRAHPGATVVADSLVAASIIGELNRAHVVVDPLGASDHAKACGTFVDLLAAGRLSHRAQAVLDDAVAGAARRPLGDAWLWSRSRSGVDISPLVAVTLAAYTAHTRRRGGQAAVIVSQPSEGGVGTRRPLRGAHAALQRPIPS